MRRLLSVLGFVLILSSTGVAAVAAVPSRASSAAAVSDHALGIVPVLDQSKGAGRPKPASSNLSYHGGPVMQAGNRTYAIFWDPLGGLDQTYQDTITGYFGNVAVDSGKATNVYASDTQYSSILYQSSYGAAFVDTNAYPPNGCTDKATSICLSDAELRTELQSVMSSNQWHTSDSGIQNLFFIFTPKGVGSCVGSSCAYTNYCAYHWAIAGSLPDGSDSTLYAIQPYAAQTYRIYTCDSGQHPNNTTADATLNVVSHEHNEAITDELGTAWYDSQGAENGDKCAWNFGTAIGGLSGFLYNQAIGTGHYYLQQEWSNATSGCVLAYQ